MKDDPIIAEIQTTRKAISAKFDHRLEAIFADARRRQNSSGRQVVRMKRKTVKAQTIPVARTGK